MDREATLIQLSEFAGRLLSVLEELRYDNVCALLNTITARKGGINEVQEMSDAMVELLDKEFIEMLLEPVSARNATTVDPAMARDLGRSLEQWVSYDYGRGYWILNADRSAGPGLPLLQVTTAGLNVAVEILAGRGYMWWQRGQ